MTRIEELRILQNKAIRAIFWEEYAQNETHTIDLYKRFEIVPIDVLVEYETTMLIHKIQPGQLRYNERFETNSSIHQYHTRSRNDLRARINPLINMALKSLCYQGVRWYNDQPNELKH